MDKQMTQNLTDRLAELKAKDYKTLTPAEKTELKELVRMEKEDSEVK